MKIKKTKMVSPSNDLKSYVESCPIINGFSQPFFLVSNPFGEILFMNKAAEEIFYSNSANFKGRYIQNFIIGSNSLIENLNNNDQKDIITIEVTINDNHNGPIYAIIDAKKLDSIEKGYIAIYVTHLIPTMKKTDENELYIVKSISSDF